MKIGNANCNLIVLVLIALIFFSLLTTCVNFGKDTFIRASNETNQITKSLTNSSISTQNPDAKVVLNGNAKIEEHKISSSELLDLKKLIGVYTEGQNYNHIVNGYGTGFKPPSEAEWNTLEDTLSVVDSINSLSDNLGSPLSVDESTTPWFPPIGNQDGQGSCTTWSVGYYTKTFQEAYEHNWDLSGATWQGGYTGHPTPSYQNKIASPAFIYNLINGGVDQGSSFAGAMQLVCFVGDSSWSTMPYINTNYTVWPSEQAWTEAPFFRGDSSGYQIMYTQTDAQLASLKSWISSGHLATIAVDSSKLYSNLGPSDLWTTDNYVNPSTDHAGTIVGYNDNMSYTEGGTTHYGAFKVANSWGVGGWEQVPDGFYWISYAAMKQLVAICYFYYDSVGYNPTLEATFQIQHPIRSECNIQVGIGNPNFPITTKTFNQYINGGALPFCQNNIVFDISEFQNSMSNVNGQTFFLRVLDGGTSTTGTIKTFSINKQNSNDTPCQTLNQQAVYLNLTFGTNDWPMLHHDLQHTGTAPSTAPNTNNTLWSYTTSNSVASSPAVIGGVVYIGSDDGSVYALNALSGVKLWSFTAGDTVHSSPSVVGGVVYVGSWDDNVYALNATSGVKLWSYTTGSAVYSSSAVVNGVVYIGSYDSIVYALNATSGVKLWSYTTGDQVHSSPAVVGGVVYIGSGDGNVYALNAATGAKLWSFTSGSYYYTSSPAVVGGVVYIGSFDGKVYALSAATGAKLWSYTTGNTVFASPAVRNGVVYIDSADGNVYALNATSGVKLWSYTTGSIDSSSPAVVDGVVFVGSGNDKVYALNATSGVKLWSYTTGDGVGSSPAVVDGKVYVGSNDGKLYCFGLPASIRLTGATISSGGSGYTTPHVALVGGGGSGATATARVSQGVIFGITLTNAGSGYTSPPTIIFRDPSPRAKGAAATINYAIP